MQTPDLPLLFELGIDGENCTAFRIWKHLDQETSYAAFAIKVINAFFIREGHEPINPDEWRALDRRGISNINIQFRMNERVVDLINKSVALNRMPDLETWFVRVVTSYIRNLKGDPFPLTPASGPMVTPFGRCSPN